MTLSQVSLKRFCRVVKNCCDEAVRIHYSRYQRVSTRTSSYHSNSRHHVKRSSHLALTSFLDELHQNRGISINLTSDTLYCMDNCAFRYLCAERQGVKSIHPSIHANHVEAWDKSCSETYRLIKHFTDIKPHSAVETATLNEARRIILSLAKPLALITKEIQVDCYLVS